MIMRLLKGIIAALLLVNISSCFAGIVIGGTRVIFPGSEMDTTISIYNKETELPYLIQAWVEPFDSKDKSKPPFTVVPPVSRLEASQEKILRIIKTAGDLPKDCESVFWLSVKNIPPTSTDKDSSKLEIAVKTKIKLFWRPAGITLKPEKAVANVKWHKQGNNLIVKNNNPIHINIMDVLIDGKDVPLNMIRPFETLTLPLPSGSGGHSLDWRFIYDTGAVSKAQKQAL